MKSDHRMVVGILTCNRGLRDPLEYLRRTIKSMLTNGVSNPSAIELWICPNSPKVDLKPVVTGLPTGRVNILACNRDYNLIENTNRLIEALSARAKELGLLHFTISHDDVEYCHRALDRVQVIMEREITDRVGMVTFVTPYRECEESASSLWQYSGKHPIREQLVSWNRLAAMEFLRSPQHGDELRNKDEPYKHHDVLVSLFFRNHPHWRLLGHNPCLVSHFGIKSSVGYTGMFERRRQTRNFQGVHYDAISREMLPDRQLQTDLISCLCVTQSRRASRLRRAIADFKRQSYANLELVVVARADSDPHRLVEHAVHSAADPRIHLYYVPDTPTLGRLRNTSVEKANGQIVCQWDDDDRYHPDRVAVQYSKLTAYQSRTVCLSDEIYFMEDSSRLYWVRRPANEVEGWNPASEDVPCFANSLMAYRSDMPQYCETGKAAVKCVDEELLSRIPAQSRAWIANYGYLYIRMIHDTNTWDMKHHLRTVQQWSMGSSELRRYCDQITDLVATYGLRGVIRVSDKKATVYSINDWPNTRKQRGNQSEKLFHSEAIA